MAEWLAHGLAQLRADDQAGGGIDPRRVLVGHQHAPSEAGTGGAVQGRSIEGHGEPNLAEGADRLGGMVPALAG